MIFLHVLSPLLLSSQPRNLSEDFSQGHRACSQCFFQLSLYFLLLLFQFLFLSFAKTLLSKTFLTIAAFVLRSSCSILLDCRLILQHLISVLIFFQPL